MYRVEIGQKGVDFGAYETVYRWQAEDYYQRALAWNAENNLCRHILMVVVQGEVEVEIIHDNRSEEHATVTGAQP